MAPKNRTSLAGSFLSRGTTPSAPAPTPLPRIITDAEAKHVANVLDIPATPRSDKPDPQYTYIVDLLWNLDDASGKYRDALNLREWAVWKLAACFGMRLQQIAACASWLDEFPERLTNIMVPPENQSYVARNCGNEFTGVLCQDDRARVVESAFGIRLHAARGHRVNSKMDFWIEFKPITELLRELQHLNESELTELFSSADAKLLHRANFVVDLITPDPSAITLAEKRSAQLDTLGVLTDNVAANPVPALRWMSPQERRVIPAWVMSNWNGAEAAELLGMDRRRVSEVVRAFLDQCRALNRKNSNRATNAFVARVIDQYEREEPDLEAAFCIQMGGACAAFGGAVIRSCIHNGERTFERWGQLHETGGGSMREPDDGGEVADDGWGDSE
jgi:hypothetical protein